MYRLADDMKIKTKKYATKLLSESRSGANITEDELRALDEFVSPMLINSQSPHHIVANNPDSFNVSEKTIYRYVAGNLLSAHTLDMPRVCRIKPRKTKPVQHKVDSGCRIGRIYPEFLKFVEDTGRPVVEMDSVIGFIFLLFIYIGVLFIFTGCTVSKDIETGKYFLENTDNASYIEIISDTEIAFFNVEFPNVEADLLNALDDGLIDNFTKLNADEMLASTYEFIPESGNLYIEIFGLENEGQTVRMAIYINYSKKDKALSISDQIFVLKK